MDTAQLKEVLDELGKTTGAHSFKECHDALEAQRQLGELIGRSDEPAKRVLVPQWEKLPAVWLRQQMAAYDLLERVDKGDKLAALQLDEMITACKAVMQ